MLRRLIGLLLLCLFLPVIATAQETVSEFPTVAALDAAVVPPRDLTDLARRFNGVQEIAPPPIDAEPLTVGTRRTLWASNSSTSGDGSFQVEAELVVVGNYIYLWEERGANLNRDALERLAEEFDTLVYEQTRALWGSEASPGIDGDPRVHGVFVRNLGWGVGAYYAAKHSYPVEAVPTSNEMEMLFYNLDAIEYMIGSYGLTTITAHEFQHMIRANVDQNEDGWMDEGFSSFTEWYLGDTDLGFINSYLSNPNVQLNTWSEDGNRTADYGAAQLWVTYLYERFGEEGLRTLSADPANGFYGIDALARAQGTDANTLFADWVLANGLVSPSRTGNPHYGYSQLAGLNGVATAVYTQLPVQEEQTIRQYAARYMRMTNLPDDIDTLTIEVTAPGVVGLADTKSPSDTPMWYSNRGDDSNTKLTIPLDLTAMTAPTLHYDIWYFIENLWDYGYVLVSTDAGESWDILNTPNMTDENPYFNAYGFSYTGRSEGWLSEQIDLSAYAGQEILLRFEMIYDDAINQPGILLDYLAVLDDTAVEAYYNDFSDPTTMTHWESAGWVLTDNRLPQSVWVQAVTSSGERAYVERWLHTGGTESYTLPLQDGAQSVTVVLSPFAPTTTVPTQVGLVIR